MLHLKHLPLPGQDTAEKVTPKPSHRHGKLFALLQQDVASEIMPVCDEAVIEKRPEFTLTDAEMTVLRDAALNSFARRAG